MSTPLQERLADEIVKDIQTKKPRNKKTLLVSSGYSESSATSVPERVLTQIGVKEALKKRGFTIEGADAVVHEILYKGKKEESRLKAAGMVYDRFGANAPKKTINVDFEVPVSDPRALALANKFEQEMQKLLRDGTKKAKPRATPTA